MGPGLAIQGGGRDHDRRVPCPSRLPATGMGKRRPDAAQTSLSWNGVSNISGQAGKRLTPHEKKWKEHRASATADRLRSSREARLAAVDAAAVERAATKFRQEYLVLERGWETEARPLALDKSELRALDSLLLPDPPFLGRPPDTGTWTERYKIDEIRRLGAKWDKASKAWLAPSLGIARGLLDSGYWAFVDEHGGVVDHVVDWPDWCISQLDRLVDARLESEGPTASERAEKEASLQRRRAREIPAASPAELEALLELGVLPESISIINGRAGLGPHARISAAGRVLRGLELGLIRGVGEGYGGGTEGGGGDGEVKGEGKGEGKSRLPTSRSGT